jgi:hypothetical protein
MSYVRVIPRDLFNEGNLLTCLGKLAVKLEDTFSDPKLTFDYDSESWVQPGFIIEQDETDGSISAINVQLLVDDVPVVLYRPLNTRSSWPLWSAWPQQSYWNGEDNIRVFTEDGELNDEFVRRIKDIL